MKKCPYCQVEVHVAVIVCPNCNSNLIKTVPFGVVEEQAAMEQAHRRESLIARLMFVVVMAFMISCVLALFFALWNSY